MAFRTESSGPGIHDAPSPRWIFDQIEEWAHRSPDRVAFVLDNQDKIQEYSFAHVVEQSDVIADLLTAKGIHCGDRVGVLMENVPQWVFVLLGAMRVGAITVPLATTLPEASLQLIAEHAGCKLIFADEANWEKGKAVTEALGKMGSDPPRETGLINPAAVPLRERGQTPFSPRPTDTAVLIYTSGTTGNPKGVELTFDNLNHEIRGAIEALRLTQEHRILSVLPFSHVLPLIANGLGPMCIGARVVFLSSISPQRIIDAFHRHRITLFVCVPQFFYILHKRIFSNDSFLFRQLRKVARHIGSTSLQRKLFAKVHSAVGPDLRMLASGGSHLDPSVARDLSELGYMVLQAYGLTETSAAATVTSVDANRLGTVGKPIRGVTVRINQPNEKGIGEVLVRGPIIMKGYYRAPEKTAEAVKDGWFHSGDLGFIDADGYLSITGRIKDVIVLANGENVYPEELETHYAKSPFIKELCILGLSEEGTTPGGGILHAIVVPDMEEFKRVGQTGIMEMIRFEIENLSKQVPSFYRIHSLAIRNEPLPRTVTRKLKRFEIQQEEIDRRKQKQTARKPSEDHERFRSRVGSVIAQLVRETKPDAGALDPKMNLELDLGFDSLARVELLGLAESRLGTHIDEQAATRIFTLGELVDAFESASGSETSKGGSWKEIIQGAAADPSIEQRVFGPRPFMNPVLFVAMGILKTIARVFFRVRVFGLDKLPHTPFLVCPNHDSFLDGPFVVAALPKRVRDNLFILGYSDYWQGGFSRWFSELIKIVPVDPNVNLVRAMQAGAAGLKKGRVLLVFPEGTRSIDGFVAEFKKGAAILAYELGVPIVPLGIRGSYEAWPRGGSFRFHPIEFHFGEPLDPRAFGNAADPYTAITDKLRTEVKTLAGE